MREWHEFKIIGEEIDRFKISMPDGRICIRVKIKLYLRNYDLKIPLKDIIGNDLVIETDLYCYSPKEKPVGVVSVG